MEPEAPEVFLWFDEYRRPRDGEGAIAALVAAVSPTLSLSVHRDSRKDDLLALERLLSGAAYAWSMGHPALCVPMDHNDYLREEPYWSPVHAKAVRRMVGELERAGWWTVDRGYAKGDIVVDAGEMTYAERGQTTLVTFAAPLLAAFVSTGVTLRSTQKTEGSDLVVLKTTRAPWETKGRKVGYALDRAGNVAKDRANVRRLVDAWFAADLVYHGTAHIDINNRYVARHYSGGQKRTHGWRLNGRLYGERGNHPWWYQLNHADRIDNVTINGERVCGVDFKSTFMRLAFAGFAHMPQGDLYAIPWVTSAPDEVTRKVRRDTVKSLCSSLFFRTARPRRWPEKMAHPSDAPLSLILDQIEEAYPALMQAHTVNGKREARRLYSQFGFHLLKMESDIILRAALTLLDEGIVALTVHDCLVVGQSHAERAEQAMREAWRVVTRGGDCPVTIERPREVSREDILDAAASF